MKKIFRKIHLWLSVPFGLIITLVCFSGAMLVFENEVNEWFRHDLYYVETVKESPLPMDKLLEKVATTLPDSVSVTVSTLLLVFVLISGIVIWWPRTRKALKNSLKITVSKGWRRFWYDLHVAGGMYALIFLLAMALTGLTWSFPWYRTAFYKVFGVEVQQRFSHGNEQKHNEHKGNTRLANQEKKRGGNGRRSADKREGLENNHSDRCSAASPFACWQEVYDKLRHQNLEYKQISVSSGTASVSFDRFGNQRASDRYSFNTDTGEFTETSLYQHQDKSGKIRGWIYSVHVGSWGGMLTRILAFIAALIGAALPLTGYYLWMRKFIRQLIGTKK